MTREATSSERVPRVLFLSTQRGWGGGEEQLRLTVAGLAERGWEVVTVCPQQSRLAERLQAETLETVTLPGRGRGPLAWWHLRRVVRHFRPQMIWMNDPHAIIHGLMATVGLKTVKVGARRTVFRLRSGWLYRRALRAVVCPSQACAAACREARVPETRIRVIYEGVDVARLEAANPAQGRETLRRLAGLPAGGRARFLVHAGKLTPAKGQDLLIRAFADIIRSHEDSYLVMAGDGEWRAALERQIAELGLTGRAVLAGFRSDVLDLVAAADVFVFPSRQEGLGGAVMEACMLGVPVVATSAGGIPEIFAQLPEATGVCWLVPPEDASQLARAVQQALALSPAERAERLATLREAARRRFAAARMVEETAAFLQSLAGTQSSAGDAQG